MSTTGSRDDAGSRVLASTLVMLVIASALTAGCASVTFKRGATPSTMAADESRCRKADPADSAFRACMRDKGWFVAGGADAATSTGAFPDRAGEHTSPMAKVIDFSAPTAAARAQAPAPATTPTLSTQSQAPATSPAATTATPRQRQLPVAAVVSAPSSPAAAPEPAPIAAEPTLIGVASWWKFGGTAGGLDADIAACTHKLGNGHRPAPAATLVTREMGECLREHGWYALGKSR